MLSALLAGALIVVASLLLGSAIMAIAGLPRHSAVGPATGISALLVICGIAVKLPGHAVTAAVVTGLALIGCFVVFGRARVPAGTVRVGAIVAVIGAALVVAIPFATSGRVGILGQGLVNDDMASHLLFTEWITSHAGPTFWTVEQGGEILAAYRDFILDAPRELNGFFLYGSVPPGPPFPEELHLRQVSGVVWCYVGDEADAAEAMAPFLDAVPEPLMHGVQPMPHSALQGAFDPVYPKGDQWYWRADFVKEIPDEAVELHAKWGQAMPTWKSTMHLYPIDGAAHDLSSSDTAWSYRDANWGAVFAGVDPEPANVGAIGEWSRGYQEALHPHSAGGAYVNMMMDEGQERVRASYRDNYDRLARIKATYDPGNLFRVNQNIEPAA
jgi:hypothetical protein